LLRAVYSGLPVARVGRGNNEGFAQPIDPFIGGGNLTSTKARLLLMACLMRFGSLPPAADPDRPTAAEREAISAKLADYQAVFDTH
jgi:L-asparaginase